MAYILVASLCLLAGWLAGSEFGPERIVHRVARRVVLCLIRTEGCHQRRCIVQFDGEAWDRAEDLLIEKFANNQLLLGELHGAEECREAVMGRAGR